MPKSKTYNASSALRHRAKMERIFMNKISEETAVALASTVNAEWERKFGYYNEAYRKLKQYLASAHPEVPKALYGLYRSFLFKALKEVPRGSDPNKIVDEFRKNAGLDQGVMYDILEQFGLSQERSEEESVTKQ